MWPRRVPRSAFVLAAAGLVLLAVLMLTPGAPRVGAAESAVPQSRAEMRLTFSPLVKRVSPAVVSINVTSKVDASQLRRQIPGLPFDIVPRGAPDEDDEDGGQATPKGKGGQPVLPKQQSSGSGFFISAFSTTWLLVTM